MTGTPNWIRLHSGLMDWEVFRLRERVIRAARSFFRSKGFMEIEAPLLVPCPTLDSNIHPFRTEMETEIGGTGALYLHTSPEHAMKKLLVAGSGDIFYLGKVFRNREQTRLHNPEFTMIEWYRVGADYLGIQRDAEDLIQYIIGETGLPNRLTWSGKEVDFSPPWNRSTVRDLFHTRAGINLDSCPDAVDFAALAGEMGIVTRHDDDWESVFFRVFLEKIEPGLGLPKPVFVVDYPLCMGLMAERKQHDPQWVERAELYVAGLELANGYTELTDAAEQRRRFREDSIKKRNQGSEDCRIDEELLHALELGLPPCAGMALGLDRLIMLLSGKTEICDVLLFPHQPGEFEE
ncbi:MAG TPA: EF-P lysine aminoacylase EpmA [bacterium]